MSEPMTLQDLADQIEAGFRKVADAWNGAIAKMAQQLATVDASAPADPGEGHRTGTGGPDAPGASEGLDAAIEAATIAIEAAADEWNASGKGDITLMEAEAEYYDLPGVRADDGEPFARVAVRAAYPLIRRTIAEQIARRIEAEYADTGSDHDAGLFNAAEIAREVGRG